MEMFPLDKQVTESKSEPKKLGLTHNPRVRTVEPTLVIRGNMVRRPNHSEVTRALIQLKKEIHRKLYTGK